MAKLSQKPMYTLNTENSTIEESNTKSVYDYRHYQEPVRSILREINDIEKNTKGSFNWFESGREGIHISSSLLRKLADNEMLTTEKGSLVMVADEALNLSLYSKLVNDKYEFTLKAGELENPHFLNESFILYMGVLYPYSNMGPVFKDPYPMINKQSISYDNLSTFYSIFASRYPAISIHHLDWDTIDEGTIPSETGILLKEIDKYNYLHIIPATTVTDMPFGFLEDNDVDKIAILDSEAHTLVIKDILYPEKDPVDTFSRLVKKAKTEDVYHERNLFLLSPDYAVKFINENILELISNFTIYNPDLLSHYKIKYKRPRVSFNFASGIDFLSGEADVSIDDEHMSLNDFLSQYRKYGYVKLKDDNKAYIDNRFMKALEKIKVEKNGEVKISKYDIIALEAKKDFEVTGKALADIHSFYKGFNEIEKKNYETSLKTSSLRSYQVAGYKWMRYLHDTNMGGCLADEMGLGKTVQIIALLNDIYKNKETKPTLLVCPKSLIGNWENEIKRFSNIKTYTYYGSGRNSDELKKLKKTIIISSYATVRNDIDKLENLEFAYALLDESQNIKSLNAMTTQSLFNIKSEHRLALSGTPIENNLGDLFSMFRFINPAVFPSISEFNERYAKPIQNGDEDAGRELRLKISPFVLRRLKKNVLNDLPDKTESVSILEPLDEHFEYYEKRRKEIKKTLEKEIDEKGFENATFNILQALTELRQIASLPEARMQSQNRSVKREFLSQMIPELAMAGHKILIFANFLDSIAKIEEDLDELGINYLVMTGSTNKRSELVNQFQNDKSIPVFLMTLKTGGVGLNLTAADYVFIYDPWWNVAAEEQAINRTHRIGQKNPVFCYRLIAKGTIEEKMHELQEKKRSLATSVLSSDGSELKKLSEDDLRQLLG